MQQPKQCQPAPRQTDNVLAGALRQLPQDGCQQQKGQTINEEDEIELCKHGREPPKNYHDAMNQAFYVAEAYFYVLWI